TNLIYQRIYKNYPVEKILAPRSKSKRYTVNGTTLSIREWGDKLNIDPQLIYARVYAGWSIEEALNPLGYKRDTTKITSKSKITYNNKTQEVRQWAMELGITSLTLVTRIRRHGIEYAMTKEIKTRKVPNSTTSTESIP